MGYCVTVDGDNFSIFESNIDKKIYRYLEDLKDEGWYFVYDSDQNIVAVNYEREKWHFDEIDSFKNIASIVTAGSYINFHGEDGDLWRWVFDGASVKEIKPKIIWE